MSAVSVNPPYPIFTDTDGQPLENGYIWIGTVNLDPQGNPINVYWDSALTQVAGQPIRTINGYPSRNGSPSRLFVNSEYSIRVQNKNGTTVASVNNNSEALGDINSALVTFIQSGTGAVSRSVQSKLRDTVSVKDFGADPTGAVNFYSALMAAHNALPAAGGVIDLGDGVYLLETQAVFTKAITLRGRGSSTVNSTAGATTINKAASLTADALVVTALNTTFESFTLQGIAGNTGTGITVKAGRFVARDVSVFAMGGDGIRIGTDSGGENCNLWYLENVKAKANTGYGLKFSEGSGGLADCNGGMVNQADVQVNGTGGVYIGNAQLNTFVNLVCQQNTGRGLELSADASYNSFFGGDFEANTGDEINIATGATQNNFFGQLLTGSITDSGTGTLLAGVRGSQIGKGVRIGNELSTDLKTLDYYQEIDFSSTVAVEGTSTAGTGTYTTKQAQATRIGDVVQFKIYCAYSAHTGTGNIKITGLPFQSAGSGIGRTNLNLFLENYTYTNTPIAYLADSSTEINLYTQSSGAGAAALALDTAATVVISGSYKTYA